MNNEEFDKNTAKRIKEFDSRKLAIANYKKFTPLNGQNTYIAYLDLDGFKEKLYQNSDKLFQDFKNLIQSVVHSYLLGVVQQASGNEEAKVDLF